jgi:hypothetical protein
MCQDRNLPRRHKDPRPAIIAVTALRLRHDGRRKLRLDDHFGCCAPVGRRDGGLSEKSLRSVATFRA